MVTSSVILRSEASLPADASRRTKESNEPSSVWLAAEDVFTPGTISNDSFLTFFESSENRRRSFCGRCGTNLTYAACLCRKAGRICWILSWELWIVKILKAKRCSRRGSFDGTMELAVGQQLNESYCCSFTILKKIHPRSWANTNTLILLVIITGRNKK
jgi:hypothetical protein